jgi:Tol biopolymer transport system component
MSEREDAAWLIALGTDISEGKAVDWERASRQAADRETRKLLESLKQLAHVVDAQRSAGSDEASPPAIPAEPATAHWRHLVLYERVGAGAFGAVHRAWDTQLDREVAVKLLVKTRSSRQSPLIEARHLARVRHPNVVTVYGAEQDGEQVGIWMEYIHGDTLATMVEQRGAMSAREVAGIGIDLCRALSALHAASLLHRDIKAHNVMREVGGRIVLMDFSGARSLVPGDGPAELSGTPLYMAPEVLAGGEGTVASEVYSLGVLLFYLLSGRYPVEGATLADIKTGHKGGTRTRLRDLRPELPEAFVQVVERACAPDTGVRYRTVGELEAALMGALGTHVLSPSLRVDPQGRRRFLLGAAAAAAALLLIAASAWSMLRPRPPDPLLFRMTLGPPYNNLSWPRISRDGTTVLFGTMEGVKDVLYTWPLAALEGSPLIEAGARETPFWSHDGRYVGFFDGGRLKTVSTAPGAVPEDLTAVPYPRGADWNRDGTILFATEAGIQRIEADGTGQRLVTALDRNQGDTRHAWPSFLPDGRRFLYVIRSSEEARDGIYLGALDSGASKRILPAYSRGVVSASGHVLFVRDRTLLAQRWDDRAEEAVDEPVALASNVRAHEGGDAAFDVSDNGVLVYRLSEGLSWHRVQLIDRRGRLQANITNPGYYRQPRLSPDGRYVAVETVEPGTTEPDIWIYDLARDGRQKITSHPGADVRPVWSPDGTQIAYSSRRGAQFDVYVQTVGTIDPERLIDSSPGDKFVEDWARDGTLAMTVLRSGLWTRSIAPGQKPAILQKGSSDFWHAEFSPDGRYVAYVSDGTGQAEVFVEPLPRTGVQWKVSTQGGTDPHWRGDGRELVYLSREGNVVSVEITEEQGWRPGTPVVLFRAAVPDAFGPTDISYSRDGTRFVINTVLGDPPVPPLHVVVNWPQLVGQ